MDDGGTCGSCGRRLGASSAFCTACGTPVPKDAGQPESGAPSPPHPPAMTKDRTVRLSSLTAATECHSCGARIEADALFCPTCGAPPNGTTSAYRPMSTPAPHAPSRAERVRPAPAPAEPNEHSDHRGNKRLLVIGLVVAAVVVVAGASLFVWRMLAAPAPVDQSSTDTTAPASPGQQAGTLPGDEAIASMLVPADALPAPTGAGDRWAQVGEFRRTFEAGKPYDRCSGSISPGDARRLSHEYRLGATAVFATEAVTVFGNDADASAFYESEGQAVPGCNQADASFAPVVVAGTDGAVTATSGTAQVVRMRKGSAIATITVDRGLDWHAFAEDAARRLGTH